MYQPLYVAATGMSAFEEEMIDISNNLANAKTVAFKKGRTELESLFSIQKSFPQLLAESLARREAGTQPPVGIEFGTGVRIAATPKDFGQGTVEVTNNQFDLAIQGEGFLQFRMPDGTTAFGRAGNLHVDNEGNLVDPNGHLLEPPVVLPSGTTSVTVKQDGTVFASVNNQLAQGEIGRLRLTRFTNPAGLKSIGQNLYAATTASGEPIAGDPGTEGYGTIHQFSLETSNVDVITELTRMIMVQRVFDVITKAVQSYESMLASVEKMKQ